MTDLAVSSRLEWQNKKIIRIIFSFFIAIGVIVNTIAPFSIVKAESATYYLLAQGCNDSLYVLSGKIQTVSVSTANVRGVILKNPNNNKGASFIVSDSNFLYDQAAAANACYTPTYSANSYNYNGTTYYYRVALKAASAISSDYLPIVETTEATFQGYNSDVEVAIKYTYGEYAVDPGPSINYGNIKDLSYSTNIVGSGTSSGDANIDTITWYPYWDNNDNISTTWNMQIQVVPGTWQGGTNTDIFSQSYQDFIINESGATDIYRGTYLNGSVSISWGEVKNKLSILSWADLFQYFDGTYWNKKGWVYRARYNDPETDFWSEWQTVYTVTSSSGEGVENIIDPSSGTGLGDFNNNVENSYNTTSVVNNTTNVVYYYNGVPVDTNVDDEEITDYQQKIYEVSKQIRDILINLNTTNSTTENNDNDETITNNLNSVVDDLHTTENEFMTDMDEKLTDIDNTFELLNNNKFIAAANWVRTQYDNIVLDTPFELLIVFGLILSLALVIIGKVK